MISDERVRELLGDPTLTDEQVADIQIFTRSFAELIIENMCDEKRR